MLITGSGNVSDVREESAGSKHRAFRDEMASAFECDALRFVQSAVLMEEALLRNARAILAVRRNDLQ